MICCEKVGGRVTLNPPKLTKYSWLLDTYFTFFHGRRVGLCSGAFWRVKAGELGFVSAWQVSLRCVFILVRQVWCVVSILGGSGYVQL